MSPVLVNLTGSHITLLGPFEKDSSRWPTKRYINIHDGTEYSLIQPGALLLAQTFEMLFSQYHLHPEYKSLTPDGTPCKGDTSGLLTRYPVTTSGFRLIAKETERGWEQSEDISTLLPSLKLYERSGITPEDLRQRLLRIPLGILERETDLSKHTILRARRGERLHPRVTAAPSDRGQDPSQANDEIMRIFLTTEARLDLQLVCNV